MDTALKLIERIVIGGALFAVGLAVVQAHASVPTGFAERDAEVNGVRIYFSIGSKSSPVVLLHGYAQTTQHGCIHALHQLFNAAQAARNHDAGFFGLGCDCFAF